MAINTNPDLRCLNRPRHDLLDPPPAVGFVPDESMGADGQWWPYCQPCIDDLEADSSPIPHEIVYLDPTGRPGRVDR